MQHILFYLKTGIAY